ncbi:MAG: zinc ABC transporter substrate-binding protein [Desulfarculales bacterium]|jgi:zinc transport system substrate-binding protein|nr:zinc ABC transporter substrate-binding protein [Desulfarculales bacterium]
MKLLCAAGLCLFLAEAVFASSRPSLLVSIPPMACLLEQVAGDDYEVKVLIPPGSSPHTFELTPRRMAGLSQCRAFFSLDMPLERRLGDMLRSLNPDLPVINLNRGVRLRYYQEGEEDRHEGEETGGEQEPDPHTWLNPLNAIIQAEIMAESLSALEPSRGEYYRENLNRLSRTLRELDEALESALAPFAGMSFLAYHPAFGYLAERYGLTQMAVEQDGKEPGPRRLAATLERARDIKVKIIFIQPSLPQRQAQALARELGAQTVSLDPLAKDYILNLKQIAGQLRAGWQ